MADGQPAARTWEPLWLTEPGSPPFKVSVTAIHYNTGSSGVRLWCSCAHELSYGDDDSGVPLEVLNADAAEHLRGHGQERPDSGAERDFLAAKLQTVRWALEDLTGKLG